jgi:hypothetical protein
MSTKKPTNPPKATVQEADSIFQSKWMNWVALASIFIITIIFYLPTINNQAISAHDYLQGILMSHNLVEHYSKTGEYSNWATNMFSGNALFSDMEILSQYIILGI